MCMIFQGKTLLQCHGMVMKTSKDNYGTELDCDSAQGMNFIIF